MNDDNSFASVARGMMFALGGYAIYSVHDTIVKSLHDYHVFQILFFAMLFCYVPFSVVRILAGEKLSVTPINPALGLLRALLHVSSLGLAFAAFATLPLTQAYVLLFCTPVIISVLAIIFLGEKIALVRWLLIALGLIGVIIVLRPTVETIQLGHLFTIGCAFCSASSAIIARKIGSVENMATMILFPLIATIVVSGGALYFVYKPMPLIDLSLMFLVGALGLLAQYCILSGFRLAPATYIAPMQYSQIIWAILFGFLFFGESVDQWVIIGSSITVASGIAMIFRERQVSKVRANLNTRNSRAVGAPLMTTRETDKSNEDDWL